jgi:hypothetical protein
MYYYMEVCSLAKAVFLLSIIGISLDIYLAGFSIMSFLTNVIVTFLFIWLTNWSCYKEGYNWIAWIVVIFTFISLMATLFVIKNQDNEEIKKVIDEERQKR